MKINCLRLQGIRCFDDTGWIELSPRCNIFIGQNNAGKSTLLRAILATQGISFVDDAHSDDIRPGAPLASYEVGVRDVPPEFAVRLNDRTTRDYVLVREFWGERRPRGNVPDVGLAVTGMFSNERPHNQLVPFIARRKAVQFNQTGDKNASRQVNGTLQNLYSRVDLIVSGHPRNAEFQAAIREIVGLDIATQPSDRGKEAGFYFDDHHFISLERMGDGVSEMVGLIVEMCLERGKVFVLEEPETNLHPKGLKALLSMMRAASDRNQFIIATHSNTVVRELATDDETKVFRVSRTDDAPRSPSKVEEVPRTPTAHRDLLRELGYEFADFDLHDGWLFLEEASAESVIRSVLIPMFAPSLRWRLRTFSAGGVTNVEPSITEFKRLVTFVHLEPVYRGRMWVRVDGDEEGERTVAHLRETFDHLDERSAATFKERNFEKYYPARFREKVDAALGLPKKERNAAKDALRKEVLEWSNDNGEDARAEWAESAKEPIELLHQISGELDNKRRG